MLYGLSTCGNVIIVTWLETKYENQWLKKIIRIAPKNSTQNMEAFTGKCSAANSFLKILTNLLKNPFEEAFKEICILKAWISEQTILVSQFDIFNIERSVKTFRKAYLHEITPKQQIFRPKWAMFMRELF